MSLWSHKSRILITCAAGIPPYLKEELTRLDFPVLAETIASVETEGTLTDTIRLNLSIRTGHRVLYLLKEFRAGHPGELYNELAKIPWEDYIAADGYLCVTSSVETPSINDSRFANQKCKDAIVDRIKKKRGCRPDSGAMRNRSVIYLYWRGDTALIYLDTSGEPLSRRGYRKIPWKAPMQESLAAAVILATRWDGGDHLVNPMCGGGTLAIEAALIALEKAPGLLRGNFGFMHLLGFDEPPCKVLRKTLRASSDRALRGRIIATDISGEAVAAARQNAKTAGVDHLIEFDVCDFAETPVPEGHGIMILNPEYGERMGEEKALEETYRRIGDFFKKKCAGYRGYIFTGNPVLAKRVGLRTKRRLTFFNGSIECRLLEYELYEGSRDAGTAN
jgi:putative N6-adenine-specific DNA methylase